MVRPALLVISWFIPPYGNNVMKTITLNPAHSDATMLRVLRKRAIYF